jgi:A/G-specific adenine glycosylase
MHFMGIKNALLKWYQKNKRSLPWRQNQDPYAIWISEIMLQQTTVRAVIPFYNRFLETFPTAKKLAAAREEKVLSLWSGLGYYSRARNLQKAAKVIITLKEFPRTYSELLELPGIGPYTAAAVASIAFGEEVAAVDGNVIRVISRLFNMSEDISSKVGKELIKEHARELITGQPPSQHNQAMMELGATICTAKNPSCFLCPVKSYCQAYRAETQNVRPVKKKNRSQEEWLWEMLFIQNKSNQFALVKKDNGTPWLNHLWVLPGEARPWNKRSEPHGHFKHSITHHKIFVKLRGGHLADLLPKNQIVKWVHRKNLEKFGVSSVVLKAFKHWEQK